MLPSSPHVRNVYSEEDGIIPALRTLPPEAAASTLCIDSTTLDVEVARTVAAEVQDAGASIVDAPVSGGVAGAKAATLSFLVGGPKPAYALAYPFLTYMGQRVIYCGESGSGLVAKICNNLILGVHQIVVAESMLLGQKLGLDPKVLASVINSSTGACWASTVNNPVPGALADKTPPCERDYEGGFATSLMLKVRGPGTARRGTYLVCLAGHGPRDGPGGCDWKSAADGAGGGEDLCGRGGRGRGAGEQGLLVCVPVSARVWILEVMVLDVQYMSLTTRQPECMGGCGWDADEAGRDRVGAVGGVRGRKISDHRARRQRSPSLPSPTSSAHPPPSSWPA